MFEISFTDKQILKIASIYTKEKVATKKLWQQIELNGLLKDIVTD